MPEPKFRFFLRDETQTAHAALDAMVGPLETIGEYVAFLDGLYRYRAGTEAALRSLDWPEFFGDWRPLYIADLLAADLADLGQPAARVAPASLSNDIASLLGVSYVLEGSALGARLISRRAASLGLTEHHGARHLAAQTAELANWRSLLELAEALPSESRPKAARAANDSFALASAAMRIPA